MTEAILRTASLSRRFGGLAATNNVSLELHRGLVHAVLGPNGAGKSTLINLLSGDLAPSAGSIHYRSHDITGLPPDRRSRMGIGRSYQKTNIFPAFSVFENCRLAAQSRHPRPFAIFSRASRHRAVTEAADRALAATGLVDQRARVAAQLSHGEQRQLEIAMVLATDPEVLLLDEPLAGTGAEEARRIVELLRQLRPEHAILLVEHDMDAVFALADTITVMVNGEVLAHGTPPEIRANAEVQQAYLGQEPAAR
jgi:branched-chain amino acid transport system ATP-binding protein